MTAQPCKSLKLVGDASRTRTCDLLLRRQLSPSRASQLSHIQVDPSRSITASTTLGQGWDRNGSRHLNRDGSHISYRQNRTNLRVVAPIYISLSDMIHNLENSGEFMATGLAVSIKGFEKYKGRADVTHNSWFRCSNRLLEDPDFFDFSHSEICAWIYVMSLASQKNSAEILINFDHASRIARLKEREILSAIDKLTKLQIITVHDTDTLRARDVDGTDAGSTRQDKTNMTDKTKQDLASQLVELWNSKCKTLPKASRVTDKRKATIKAQLIKYPNLEHWSQSLIKLTSSEFITDKWCPNFDDFLREDIRVKALEGKYDNRNGDRRSESIKKIRESIKKFGSYGGGDAKAFIGEDGWELVKKFGGWGRLCQMSDKQIQEALKG